MNRIVLFTLSLLYLSCKDGSQAKLLEYDYQSSHWVKAGNPDSLFTNAVVIAYDPECPVCLLYKTSIDYMAKTHQALDFFIVLPQDTDTLRIENKFYSNSNLQILYDPNNQSLKKLAATTTPHAFLLDKTGKKVYHGKIDDRVKALGVKSQTADTLYLQNAIKAYFNDEAPSITETQPVGCLIQ